MYEKFANKLSDGSCFCLEISDEGIKVGDDSKSTFYPYGSFKEVTMLAGNFSVSLHEDPDEITSKKINRFYMPNNRKESKVIKGMLSHINALNAQAQRTDYIINTAEDEQTKNKESMPKEYRKKCNVCGHIFCYTDDDLRKNLRNAKLGILSSVGTIAAAAGGNAYMAYENNKLTDKNKSKIVDYNKCPNCNSTHLVEITEEEFAQVINKSNASTGSEPVVSAADELKKFKELLDMGVITQEEFDAKKKQLLGL